MNDLVKNNIRELKKIGFKAYSGNNIYKYTTGSLICYYYTINNSIDVFEKPHRTKKSLKIEKEYQKECKKLFSALENIKLRR